MINNINYILLIYTMSGPTVIDPATIIDNYGWSVNIVQGIIAFIEGLLIRMKAPKSAVLAVAIVVSSALPPSGYMKDWQYNEKLWETIIATILGGAVLTGFYDGNFLSNAIHAFIIDTSSMAFTEEIYNSYILGGNLNVAAYRVARPDAGILNRAALG
jgi:hypothetical protein